MPDSAPSGTRRRHDRPDTSAQFRLLATLPDGARRERLRREVITAWLPLAYRLAQRMRGRGENLDDLRQVAALGLIKAVDRFDPEKSDAFEPFAIPTITGELKRHFRDCTWDVHVPRRTQEARNKVRAALQELSTGLDDCHPTSAQLAAHTHLAEDDIIRGLEALQAYRSLSLDAAADPEDTNDFSLLHSMGTTDPGFALVEDREAVKPALACLPERERRILYLRFFAGLSQKDIATELGITQMHISRLIRRTLAHLHKEMNRPARGGMQKRASR